MFRAAYTPDAVTDKTEMHGVSSAGEAPPTGGRGGWIQGIREGPYPE